jgi:type 1 fimbria pilin
VTSAIQTQINNKKDTITYGQVYATTVGASTTVFAAITGLTTFNATESNRHFAVPVAGIIKNFYVKMSGTQSATGTLVITIRNNATSSSVAVTVANGDGASPTKSDNTNTLTVAAGDLLAIQLVNNATATSASILSMAFIIERT